MVCVSRHIPWCIATNNCCPNIACARHIFVHTAHTQTRTTTKNTSTTKREKNNIKSNTPVALAAHHTNHTTTRTDKRLRNIYFRADRKPARRPPIHEFCSPRVRVRQAVARTLMRVTCVAWVSSTAALAVRRMWRMFTRVCRMMFGGACARISRLKLLAPSGRICELCERVRDSRLVVVRAYIVQMGEQEIAS